MIQYEVANSPFFQTNKNYCENIENELNQINIDCSGYCNSYGYEMEATFNKNNLTYGLRFHKHQSTQNGIIIPTDATDYAGIEITVTGLNNKFNIKVGRSAIGRFFTSKTFKNKIPSPYYIKVNQPLDTILADKLIKYILDSKISKFDLKNGILMCKIHQETTNPLSLIAGIERIIIDWEQ